MADFAALATRPMSAVVAHHGHAPLEISVRDANEIAFGLNVLRNAAMTALAAHTLRGEIGAWRLAFGDDLPAEFLTARDELQGHEKKMIAQLQTDQAALAPHLARLNTDQPSRNCWARQVPEGAPRGSWAGKTSWLTHARDHLASVLVGPGCAISPTNLQSLLQTMISFVDNFGRGLTASHETIATLAISDYGCTLSTATATQRVRTIRRHLESGGFHLTLRMGGHMTSLERLAARAHHGRMQTQCGNTCDLTLPAHLRPTPPPPPEGPAYAQGLTERLAQRDLDYRKKSTYICDYGFPLPLIKHRVAHTSAQPREPRIMSSPRKTTFVPSLRARRIADALTRRGIRSGAENGPYAHLVGDQPGQMSITLASQLIERYTPSWADIQQVMQGLAHTATSHATGYVALGLQTRPKNAVAWFTTVLQSITWDAVEHWPSWSETARAFGVDWCGIRHGWRPEPTSKENASPPAAKNTREKALNYIRQTLNRKRR